MSRDVDPPSAPTTRRGFLASVASLSGVAAATRTTAARPPPGPRIVTQNLGLGVSLLPLFFAADAEERRRVVGDLFETVRTSDVPARMAALADELVETDADVVAVQEAASVTAAGRTIDFLDELAVALDDHGATHRVDAVTTTTDTTLPAEVDGASTTVRLRDRVALLVPEDADSTSLGGDAFDAALDLPLPESEAGGLRISRGFVAARVSPPSRDPYAVVSTHLERGSRGVRTAQADELLSWTDDRTGPVVVAGDVNAGPGDPAFDAIADELAPATAAVGPTCCRANDLSGGDLSRAVDHVFARGFDPGAVTRFGLDDDVRVQTDRGRLWPSDHAGVVAALEPTAGVPPTTRPTERPTTERPTTRAEPTASRTTRPRTPTSPPETTATTAPPARTSPTATDAPGFGGVAAVVALAVAALRARSGD